MLTFKKDIAVELKTRKFANVPGADFTLDGNFDDFLRLTRSRDSMGPDTHFGQKVQGTRTRRYSDFEYHPRTGELKQLEHRAYVQSKEHNKYVGGVERHFADFGAEVLASPVVRSLIALDFEVYKSALPAEVHDAVWQCQIHQIRIEIQPGQEVEITPEGIHCDGYPFSGVHFWGRDNVEGAQSRLYQLDRTQVAETTYESVLDTTFFMDREMLHYVTPARTRDQGRPGWRQIIAISFSRPGTAYDIMR
jgi:hypothetical protein